MMRDQVIRAPLPLPSLALDSGTPCRNDEVGAGRLHHLEFIHYPKKNSPYIPHTSIRYFSYCSCRTRTFSSQGTSRVRSKTIR